MKQPQHQHAAKLACPLFWCVFVETFLGGDVRLAKELWGRLYPSPDVLYQLSRIEDSGRRPDTIKRFGELLSPAELLKACERLAPSKKGTPRRKDVLALEHPDAQMHSDALSSPKSACWNSGNLPGYGRAFASRLSHGLRGVGLVALRAFFGRVADI
jgi:hypothetical protein